jgi:hypothetical protein
MQRCCQINGVPLGSTAGGIGMQNDEGDLH